MASAIALLSGGLDSTLAVKLMLEQKIEVLALNFITPFCTCTKKGCLNQAQKIASEFDIDLRIVGLKDEYIKLVRNPQYGYGKNMNPCIDCRIFMFSMARDYMSETGASFIFTGEVLNERPMSQRLKAMKIIETESGLEGIILRPLSAKHLKPTIPEIEGTVDRTKLMAFMGRSRKPQMTLAQERGINDYPCPAGGCRLTDANYAKRLKDAFDHQEDTYTEINLLRYGRHFRLPGGAKAIVGRNEKENDMLKTLSEKNDLVLEVINYPGPITLLRKSWYQKSMEIAAGLCIAFSDYDGNGPVEVMVGEKKILSPGICKELLASLRIN
jgi:tRNA U34 2-thiouridine synthase MnmA/TrmU